MEAGSRRSRLGSDDLSPGTSLDDEGYSQFDIEETPIETADGSYEVSLAVSFRTPRSPSKNAPAIPLMSLGSSSFAR